MRTPKEPLLGPVAKLLGLGEVGQIFKAGIDAAGSLEQWSASLNDVADVEPLRNEPRLRVTLRSGESWVFGVFQHQWSFSFGGASLETRDEAVAAIRAAAGIAAGSRPVSFWPAPAAGASAAGASEPPFDVVAIRREAMASGRTIVAREEGPMRVYASPDGWVRFSFGYPPSRHADATQPSNLIGSWRIFGTPGDTIVDEPLQLHASGAITWRYQLFGALPPVAVVDGEWWWSQTHSTLVLAWRLPYPSFPDFADIPIDLVFEFGLAFPITAIGSDELVSGAGETVIRRA